MRTGVVKSFDGEFAFLSNFYENPFTWRNIVFPTGEHAFSYAKTFTCTCSVDEAHDWRIKILEAPTPAKAKYYGRSLPINVENWDKGKVGWMSEIVHARFQTSEHDMVGRLIGTGAMMLVEGNTWGDKFWGRCLDKDTGRMVGLNTLGVLLMEERGYWLKGNF